MPASNDLLDHIFDGSKPDFYAEFEGWVRGSRRYKAFATFYRDKIRAKLKHVRDDAGIKDVRAELETAALLLHEEQFALEYEKYAASKSRGPDFTVTFKTHTPFNVEVRRIRSIELADADEDVRSGKLMTVLCDKVGQMPAGIINVLWLTAGPDLSEADVIRAVTTVRQLAEQKNEAYFTRRGFQNATAFLKQFQHLSGIILCQPEQQVVWLNTLARHKVPPAIVTAIQRLRHGA